MTSTNRRQTDSRTMTRAIKLVGLALAGVCVAGCPSAGLPGSAAFSETESVTVGDGVSVEVALGAGAPSLADSTWAIRKATDDSLLFRMTFGSNGEVERLFDSFVLAKAWLGSALIPSPQAHSTDFPRGTYAPGPYAPQLDRTVRCRGFLTALLLVPPLVARPSGRTGASASSESCTGPCSGRT